MRYNATHNKILKIINSKNYDYPNYNRFVLDFYENKKMSSTEIVEFIFQNTNIKINPRNIQRLVKKYGTPRKPKESYNLAIKKGRVKWHYKEYNFKRSRLSNKIRYKILKRDDFKCVLCGRSVKDGILLEVDHIKPVSKGGDSSEENLRTLCHECNKGAYLNS